MDTSKPYKDYYYILGVPQEATPQEIQDAYHDLYEKYGPHVSVSGQDPEMLLKTFRDISEAYEMLMDPEKRKDYDKNCAPHLQKGDLRALWTKFSGVQQASGQNRDDKKPRAIDTELDLEVTLREAVKGSKKQVSFDEPKPCESCNGLKPVQRMQCPNCRGLGYATSERTEEVELPAGMFDRMVIRKTEIGKFDMPAGKRGDLVLRVKIKQHPFLSVLGRDITCTVPITIYEAVLGAEVEVPTATGKVIMKVQPRTQSGRVYRLKGLGLAGADQLVTVEVVTPQQLSDEEVGMYRRLKDSCKDPNPRESLYTKL
jgi:DnaJ-class molecular chaperone